MENSQWPNRTWGPTSCALFNKDQEVKADVPTWLMGFWSKYSSTKVSISCREKQEVETKMTSSHGSDQVLAAPGFTFSVEVRRLGFRSWSSMLREQSITTYRWRIYNTISIIILLILLMLLLSVRLSAVEGGSTTLCLSVILKLCMCVFFVCLVVQHFVGHVAF